MIMTQDKARKAATRQRMAKTGEPYSVARHAVERDHEGATAGDPPSANRGTPPGDDRWYASEAEEAGITVDEFRVQHPRLQLAGDEAVMLPDLRPGHLPQ